MKAKYIVMRDKGYDNIEAPREIVKTFKNEHDAVSYFDDPKTQRINGTVYLEKHVSDGTRYTWNERNRIWQEILFA